MTPQSTTTTFTPNSQDIITVCEGGSSGIDRVSLPKVITALAWGVHFFNEPTWIPNSYTCKNACIRVINFSPQCTGICNLRLLYNISPNYKTIIRETSYSKYVLKLSSHFTQYKWWTFTVSLQYFHLAYFNSQDYLYGSNLNTYIVILFIMSDLSLGRNIWI